MSQIRGKSQLAYYLAQRCRRPLQSHHLTATHRHLLWKPGNSWVRSAGVLAPETQLELEGAATGATTGASTGAGAAAIGPLCQL